MTISQKLITGLILAGGQGRRVNYQDKGLLEFEQQTLIERQLQWFSTQLDNTIISANRNLQRYSELSDHVVTDSSEESIGPLAGIAAALEICTTEWLFVQPVDMPFLPTDLLQQICCQSLNQATAYYLVSDTREHYLSMLISTQCQVELVEFIAKGGKRVRDFLCQVNAQALNLGLQEALFANLNNLEDYSKS